MKPENEKAWERLELGFQKPQVTRALDWYEVEDDDTETRIVPADEIAPLDWHKLIVSIKADLGEITITLHKDKYGARMSAPGYLDCTEWVLFDKEEEAEQYLIDEYDEE